MFSRIRKCIEAGFITIRSSFETITSFVGQILATLDELNTNVKALLQIFKEIKEHQEGGK